MMRSFSRLSAAILALGSAVLLAGGESACTNASGETIERACPEGQFCSVNLTILHTSDIHSRLFPYEQVRRANKLLSGGEKTRLQLLLLMLQQPNLLVLDEPTNHLDIAAREWVEDALEGYEGALIFVSHDRYFVQKFAERIWELADGHIRDFACGYEKYRAIKAHEAAQAAPAQTVPKPKKEKPKGGAKELEKQVRAAERAIEKQEQAISELDAQIADAASDYQALARLMEEKAQAEDALARLMDEWEALSLRLEDET